MRKILYFLPFVIGCILYVFLGIASSFSSINSFVWIVLGMLLVSGVLMDRGNYPKRNRKNIWNKIYER